MGVYVFECLHGPYIKVGHHMATRGRPNAYYRIAGRGFQSCVHPIELDGMLYMKHLKLLGWYPKLTREHETMIHRTFREGRIGEFHPQTDTSAILSALDAEGKNTLITEEARVRAMRWGYRQVRKAVRRAKRKAQA